MSLERSGVAVEGEVRAMTILRGAGSERLVIFGRNDDAPLMLEY